MKIENYLELKPNRVQLQKSVAPNSVERIEIPLTAAGKMMIDELMPLTLHTTCLYKQEHMPDLELNFRQVVRPVMPIAIPTQAKEPTVDGDLSDWEDLPFKFSETYVQADPFSHKGAEDVQVSFGITQGEKYVYLAAHVQDDELLADETRSFGNRMAWLGKYTLVLWNKAPMPTGFVQGCLCCKTLPLHQVRKAGPIALTGSPKGIQTSLKQVEGGFVSELAIPISLIDSLQGKDWKYLRVNVAAVDFDQDYVHETRLLWQPSWESKENFVGSGLFMRKEDSVEEKEGKRR